MPMESEILGADRHGQAQYELVRANITDRMTKAIFVGTSLSCGFYAARTTISDASGKQWSAERIVDDAAIGEMRFEAARRLMAKSSAEKFVARELWQQLVREAAFGNETDAWIRVRRSSDMKDELADTELWEYVAIGRRLYGHLRKDSMAKVLERGEQGRLIEGLLQVFRNDDNSCELSRDSSLIAMTVGEHFAKVNAAASFHYDSLQHSAAVFLAMEDRYGALARGLCAFMASEQTYEWDLSWSTTSWNPVSSGLLIKAREK